MQMILLPNKSLEADHDVLVQHSPRVHWIGAEQTAGTVEEIPQRPTLADWTAWVDRAGGRWATPQDIAGI